MRELPMTRRVMISILAAPLLACGACGGSSTSVPLDVKEGGGTPTFFDNPPLGDPLAPSQAELNQRRPPKKIARRPH